MLPDRGLECDAASVVVLYPWRCLDGGDEEIILGALDGYRK